MNPVVILAGLFLVQTNIYINLTIMATKTLFAHYKEFINKTWDNTLIYEDSLYTSKDLNNKVGKHEHITHWKRGRNRYYLTRLYQTALKDLGCITMVKRGLWKINAPIPEWFGSYHFSGLKGNLEDKSNFYWNSLPFYQKVNPWLFPPTTETVKSISHTMKEEATPDRVTVVSLLPPPPSFKPFQLVINVTTAQELEVIKAMADLNITIPDHVMMWLRNSDTTEEQSDQRIELTCKLLNEIGEAIDRMPR